MEGLPDVVVIPKGAVRTRTLARLPIEAALALGGSVLLFCLAFHTLWALLAIVPLWGFFKWHTRKDSQFMQTWSGQLSYKPYYKA